MNDFCVFIISHGRPDNIYTLKTLNNSGYTGKWFIIVDNHDKTVNKYIYNFGADKIKIFNKTEIAKTTDNGDNTGYLRSTTHARNACFDIAEKLGFTYFLVLDDDYIKFDFRINSNYIYPKDNFKVRDLNSLFNSVLKYYQSVKGLKSICFAQGGDFIGGNPTREINKTLTRKCMNSWFCSINRRFKFISRLNEDVNTYLYLGQKGDLFMTVWLASLTQMQTQGTNGGMTDAYTGSGTYVKSFMSVLYCPSFVKVKTMNTKYTRIHHVVNWSNAVPYIISEKHKKQ